MGRRPNAVVSEFFDRGAKIDDSSNRYEHTCKRCGELFPKGRLDNLLNHLVKRCPNLSQDDRNAISEHTQQTASRRNEQTPRSEIPVSAQTEHNSGLPINLERQQSALDTLAEVSRRHLDYSTQRDVLQDADQTLAEQALWAQLHQHGIGIPTSQPPQPIYDFQVARDFEQSATLHNLDQQTFSSAEFGGVITSTAGHDSHRLAQQALMTTLDPQLEPQHFDFGAPSFDPTHQSSERHSRDFGSLQDTNQSAHATVKDTPLSIQWEAQLTSTEPQETFDALLSPQKKPTRAKQRGRFTESRRKEVQELRKQGACLRCRMLKKPCSGGTPCSTCASVDTARIWKGQCIRTRLSEEFSAWSVGYFQARSKAVVSAQLLHNKAYPSPVHVRLNVDAGAGVKCTANIAGPVVDSLLQEASTTTTEASLMLENEEDLASTIAPYCTSIDILRKAIAAERHDFLRTTIEQAVELLHPSSTQEASTDHTRSSSKHEARTCYNIPTSLLRDCLELWLLTKCLTISLEAKDVNGLYFEVVLETLEYRGLEASSICRAQLLAATEHRAARLSKKVLNDLERRLLQRQQVSGFETYIAAVVLLNSVERMTAFYSSFDNAADPHMPWPLDIPASSVWNQGTSFATLLAMLLRIRGLPPKTFVDDQGILRVVHEPSDKLMKINGSASEAQLRALDEERRAALSEWLDKCAVSVAEVQSWVDADSKDWFGKFMAALLLN